MSAAKILAVALAFPVHGAPAARKAPESPDAYRARLEVAAAAIATAARFRSEAAAVLVLWENESGFLLEVHTGEIRGDGGRAICMGQIHPHVPNWEALAGADIEATTRCARETVRHLRFGAEVCGKNEISREGRVAQAFEYYARGHCGAPGAESLRRAQQWARVEAKL